MKIEQAGVIILSIVLLTLLFFVQHLDSKIDNLKNTSCFCENQIIENTFDDAIINQNLKILNEFVKQTNNITDSLNLSLENLIERVNDYHQKEKEDLEEELNQSIIGVIE